MHPGQNPRCEFYVKRTHNSRLRCNVWLCVISLRKRVFCLLESGMCVCVCLHASGRVDEV